MLDSDFYQLNGLERFANIFHVLAYLIENTFRCIIRDREGFCFGRFGRDRRCFWLHRSLDEDSGRNVLCIHRIRF